MDYIVKIIMLIKPFFFVLLFCFSGSRIMAQNWRCMQPGQKVYFTNARYYLRGMRIDSSQASGSTTVLTPFRTPRGNYLNNQVIDTNGGSWLGRKVIEQAGGHTLFLNGWGDTILIKTAAGAGSQWTFYDDNSATYYIATVQSTGVMMVAGVGDSIKTIRIQAMQNGVAVSNDIANQCSIVLSKNHGFLRVFDFYTFPYRPPAGAGIQHGFDYFFDMVKQGVGDRYQGANLITDSGKLVFTRVSLQNVTDMDYANFQPGDALQYYKQGYGGPGATQFAYFNLSTDTIGARQMVGTIPVYSVHGRVSEYMTQTGPPQWQTTSWQNPVSATIFMAAAPEFFFGIDTTLMPEETRNRFFYSYNPTDTSYCITERVFGKLDNDISYQSATINTFEPCGWYRWFKAGLGTIEINGCDDPDYSKNFVVSLVYLNRSGMPCGSYSSLRIAQNPFRSLASISPNPASESINIQLPAGPASQPVAIAVSDLTGRQVYSRLISSDKIRISVADWPAGVYLLQLRSAGQALTQKIVVQH